MANETHNSLNRWSQLGNGIILIANLILLFMVFQARLEVIEPLNIGFITTGFGILGLLVIGLVIVTTGLVLSGRLPTLLKSHIVWFWIIASLIALFLANNTIFGFPNYMLVFSTWLLLFDIGILFITYAEALSKMDFAGLLKTVLGIGFGFGITLIMLEILLRLYFGVLGSEVDRAAYIYSAEQLLEVANRYGGRPYINYGLTSTHPEHNSDAYRGSELTKPKPDDVYRIFTLGGSTTYGDSIQPHEAYPAVLEDILHDAYGYTHIEVVNAGVNAYSSFDSLANLIYRILDDEPDMIVVYHGVNDVRSRLVEPSQYTGLNLQRGIWNPSSLNERLGNSVLWRFIRIQLGFLDNPNRFETILATTNDVPRCGFFETNCSSVDNRPASEIIASNPPIYYERNLRNMAAIARANGIDVIFSTWLYYDGEVELRNPMALEHMQAAVDEQNALLLNLAAELDVPVIDFASSDALNSPEHWIDGMHMRPSGTQEQAEQYAAFLIENELLPLPPTN